MAYRKFTKIEGYIRSEVIAYVKHKLLYCNKWKLQAIEKLYAMQTESEKNHGLSKEDNLLGFDKFHSAKLSHYARLAKTNYEFTKSEFKELGKLLSPYAIQLIQLMNPIGLKNQLDKFYSTKR